MHEAYILMVPQKFAAILDANGMRRDEEMSLQSVG